MRKIERIFVHCTASSQSWGVKELWAEFKAKGWKNPGYHYVITADGGIHQMLAVEEVSNGVKGYNSEHLMDAAICCDYIMIAGFFPSLRLKFCPKLFHPP